MKCHKIEYITKQMCDLSKYADVNSKEDLVYINFSPYRPMFMRSIVQDAGRDCYGGTITLLVPEYKDQFLLPVLSNEWWKTLLDKEPSYESQNLVQKCNTTVYLVALHFYKLDEKTYKQLYTMSNADTVKAKQFRKIESTEGHLTALVVDHATRQINYFEPNGQVAQWLPVVNRRLLITMKEMYPDYNLTGTLVQECPRRGIQYYAEDSRCANWSMLYLYLRINCPFATSKELESFAGDLDDDELQQLMTGWMCFMWGYAASHGLITRYRELLFEQDKQEKAKERACESKSSRACVEAVDRYIKAIEAVVRFREGLDD